MNPNDALVCPECGSEDVGTQEAAVIWHRATFVLAPPTNADAYSQTPPFGVEITWDVYDSEDVGDTDTVGFFCRGCLKTWGEPGDIGPCPFVPQGVIVTTP